MADTVEADAAASAVPDPFWDDWETPPRVPSIPELHLAGFDGPMDLTEWHRIDLDRSSILQRAEQFVAAMERLERHFALERKADWLVIVTRLLLRSRSLFAADPEAEVEAAQDAGREARRLDEVIPSACGRMAGPAASDRPGRVPATTRAQPARKPPTCVDGDVPDRA